MYDHNAKVAGWITTRAVLQILILPGLVGLFWLAHHIFDRSDLVDVPATVTHVSEVCRAEKKRSASPSDGLLVHGEITLECARFRSLVDQGLRKDDYRIVMTSEVNFRYQSPADNHMHIGSAFFENQDISVGDKISIKASKSDFRKTVVLSHGS